MMRYAKNKIYLLACSYGPDSMALLDMLYQEHITFAVAHVNYHKRDISNFEEESLLQYCKKLNIPCYVLDTSNMTCNKNFQAWAREVRYNFFKEIYDKISAKGLFIAHHLDDSIETYLMQKERNSIHDYYGLPHKTKINGMNVLRPLLNYRKKELLDYCVSHNIPFSVDSSNLKDDYRRNQIRHEVVEKMNKKDINILKKEMKAKNTENEKIKKLYKKYLNKNELDIGFLKDEDASLILGRFLKEFLPTYQTSSSFLKESLKALNSDKNYIEIRLKDSYLLIKDYTYVKVVNYTLFKDYIYKMEEPKKLDTPYFLINFSKTFEDRRIKREDFPIYIRNALENDEVIIGQNTKLVSHLFSEWKMPHDLRKVWPIFLNKDHEITYIPRYKRDYKASKGKNLIIKKLN